MGSRIRLASMALIALGLFLSGRSSDSAMACSCAPPPEPLVALKQSAAVFLGKVVAIDDAPNGFTRVVTLSVEKWWKGGDTDTIKVQTATNGAACGFGFQKDGRYLVYAHKGGEKGGLLGASLCSRTRSVQTAEGTGDLKDLGPGQPPAKK